MTRRYSQVNKKKNTMKTFLLTIFSSISCIQFFFISHCECPDISNPGVENPVGENPDEEYVFQLEKMVPTPPHTFRSGSRPYQIQAILGYLGKPYWPSQWFMTEELLKVEKSIYGPSMKIAEMHQMNYKGENVGVVIIANSAINCNHEQIHLRCKTEQTSGYSLYPRKSLFSTARTKKYRKCSPKSLASAAAGIIGMSDEGQRGGVGVAPKCIIGNIVIEPFNSNGSPENCAYKMSSKENSLVALYVHAWQLPLHDYRNDILLHWGKFEYMNFGSEQYQLKPHVMGTGDLGVIANSCQTNEYTSADSSFVFGSVGYNGYLTPYSETCASLMGVTYSTTNGVEYYNDVVTIPSSDDVLTTMAPKGTTVVSASIAGGIVALIIDCYRKHHHGKSPSVTDLAFLLAFSANADALQNKNMIWFENAAGLKYSPLGGFGLPDLVKAYALIPNWTPIGAPRIFTFSRYDKIIGFRCRETGGRRSLTYISSMICQFSIQHVPANFYIQTVTLEITAKLVNRGSMSVYLISPGGTVSCLLESRPYDTTQDNYKKLRLRSNHFIGEDSRGQWMIKIFTYKENSKPTLGPLYAFKTGSQSASQPPTSSPPVNANGNPNNPVPTDSSLPSSVNSVVVPSPTQPTSAFPNSHVATDHKPQLTRSPPVTLTEIPQSQLPIPNSQPALPTKVSSTEGQQSHLLNPNPQPAALPEMNSNQDQQSQLTTTQGSLLPQNSLTSQPQLAAPATASSVNPFETWTPIETNPHFPDYNKKLPSNTNQVDNATPARVGSPTPSSNAGPKQSAAPTNGVPALNAQPKPPRAAGTRARPGRASPTKPNNPYASTNRDKATHEVGQISFRFVLVENLPLELKIEQKRKSKQQRDFDLELMKAWTDFRQYLLVQTDPQNYGTRFVELEHVYGIMNYFIQKLLMFQKDVNIKSLAGISVDHLRTLTATDDSPHHPPVQHSDSLAREGIHPHLLSNQEIQNGKVPPKKQGEHEHGLPSSGAQQSS